MSVGTTRGPVQRPGIDRDLREIFQRIEDLERSGGLSGFIHYNDTLGPNVGNYVTIEATGPFTGDFWGAQIEVVASATAEDANGGVYIADFGVGGLTLHHPGTDSGFGEILLQADDGSGGVRLHSEADVGDTGFVVSPGITLETAGDSDILLAVPNGRQIQITAGTPYVGGQSGFPMTANVELYAGDSTHEGKVLMAAFDGAGNASALEVGHTHFTFSGLDYYGAIAVLGAGNYFTVTDHNGHPLFQVRNDSPPTYHVKTGTAGIVADL